MGLTPPTGRAVVLAHAIAINYYISIFGGFPYPDWNMGRGYLVGEFICINLKSERGGSK